MGFYKNKYFIISAIFFIVFFTHYKSTVVTSFDSTWSIPTAVSIFNEGNTDLDEYVILLASYNTYAIENVGSHRYTFFPIGASVISLPLVMIDSIIPLVYSTSVSEWMINNPVKLPLEFERLVAAFVIALAAVFIFLIARQKCNNTLHSLLIVFIFSFGTAAWSTASRGLWQHGPSILMLSITLYLLIIAKEKPKLIQYVSIPLAFSYVVRPTNSLSIIIFSLYVLIYYRKFFIKYVLWAMTVAVPFILYNISVYNSILSPYYLPKRIGDNPHFYEAIVGNFFSPSRGIFFYSPILLLSISGLYLMIKYKKQEKLDYFITLIILLHLLVISSFSHWWGGHSFGPRFFSDMIPFLIYLVIIAFSLIPKMTNYNKKVFYSFCFVFTLISFFINYQGAMRKEVYTWNPTPVDVDLFPERLWDFKDLQFMRGLKYGKTPKNYSYLMKSDTFSKALNNFTPVDIKSISQPRVKGTPWDKEGNIIIASDEMLRIGLNKVSNEKAIEISLDNNDTYAIIYFLGTSAYYLQLLERSPYPRNMGGLNIYTIEVPDEVSKKGFDKVGVIPFMGDGRYSVGHIRFISTQITWGDGFYPLEQNDGLEWRWCKDTGYVTINNYAEFEKRISIKMNINYYHEIKQRTLTISSDSFNKDIAFAQESGAEFLKNLTIPPNNEIKIKFQADSKPISPPNDPRPLVFSVSNFQYEEDVL